MELPPHGDFESLIRDVQGRMAGFAFRVLGEAADAKDAVQDALLSAWPHWPELSRFSSRKRQQAYMYTCASRAAMQMIRKPYRRVERLAVAGDDGPLGAVDGGLLWAEDVRLDNQELLRKVWAVVSQLPERRRDAVAWFIAGYEYQEIADLLGVSVSTVGSHVDHARSALRKAGLKLPEVGSRAGGTGPGGRGVQSSGHEEGSL